jgi:hypothetical protein
MGFRVPQQEQWAGRNASIYQWCVAFMTQGMGADCARMPSYSPGPGKYSPCPQKIWGQLAVRLPTAARVLIAAHGWKMKLPTFPAQLEGLFQGGEEMVAIGRAAQ